MKKLLNKLFIPIIIIVLFTICYFIIGPIYISYKAQKDIYNDFEKGLKDLKIEYNKTNVNYKEFGALQAYKYTANDRSIVLYIYDRDSEDFIKGSKEGYIISSENEETKLYGVFENNCVLFMEAEFPNDTEVLNLFISLSEKYIKNIK